MDGDGGGELVSSVRTELSQKKHLTTIVVKPAIHYRDVRICLLKSTTMPQDVADMPRWHTNNSRRSIVPHTNDEELRIDDGIRGR
jgi:hypothetical protein